MEEEAFINDVEQQHRNLSQEMQNVVDLYKGAIVSMQEEVFNSPVFEPKNLTFFCLTLR